MPATYFRGSNYPVGVQIGANIVPIPRAQSFEVGAQRDAQPEYQLGTEAPVGVSMSSDVDATATLTWYPINVLVENLLVGNNSATAQVTLLQMRNATGVNIVGPTGGRGLNGARAMSLEYNIDVPRGIWTATVRLTGTSVDMDGANTGAPSTTGVLSFKPRHAMVRFSGYTENFLRVQSLRFRLDLETDKAWELSSAVPYDITQDISTVTGDITWHALYESGAAGPHSWRPLPDEGSGLDITVQVGLTTTWGAVNNVQYVFRNMVWQRHAQSVQVRARGTDSISYYGFNAADGGFVCSVITSN